MFDYKDLSRVQIEITNRCQASCPMCLRNIHGGITNPTLVLSDWTLTDYKKIFTSEILKQLTVIDFCGDFGEPILNNDLIDMCKYTALSNPNIHIMIHTNGSARNKKWWSTLAKALPTNHTVEFALDGLEDTHSLYRIGTAFNKIIENATAFIGAGGKAGWMFIKFKHNEHQVDTAKQMSIDLGFTSFNVKNSKRFGKTFKVLDKDGKVIYNLDQPDTSPIKFTNKDTFNNFADWPNATDIDCFVLHSKEIYIDANFNVLPCCLLGSFLYANYDKSLYEKYDIYNDSSIVDIGYLAQRETYRIINKLGGLGSINALTVGIKKILENQQWQTIWYEEWKNKTSPACIVLCSKSTPMTRIKEQLDV